jgi:hypothetical protein
MNNKCNEFEEFLLESDNLSNFDELPEVWKTHLVECKKCQIQWEAHQHLRGAISSLSVPHVSEDFANKVRIAANHQYAFKAPQGWTRFFLRLYWIATTFVASYLLFNVKLDLTAIKEAWFMYILILICFACPLLILRRSRITLFDLLLRVLG